MTDFDLYDVLAKLGYGLAPRTRPERAEAFGYKHAGWLAKLPPQAAATLRALTPPSSRAPAPTGSKAPRCSVCRRSWARGGLAALKGLGKPAEILRETKARLFAA
jgi:type I restriction enzyme R subunit